MFLQRKFPGDHLGNGDQVSDSLLNGLRRDVMFFIISHLDFPAAVGLVQCDLDEDKD